MFQFLWVRYWITLFITVYCHDCIFAKYLISMYYQGSLMVWIIFFPPWNLSGKCDWENGQPIWLHIFVKLKNKNINTETLHNELKMPSHIQWNLVVSKFRGLKENFDLSVALTHPYAVFDFMFSGCLHSFEYCYCLHKSTVKKFSSKHWICTTTA